jgi:exodeoxyribonuclease VII large subunit
MFIKRFTSISELSQNIKKLFDEHFKNEYIEIEGEITRIRLYSQIIFFDLKDGISKIQCFINKNNKFANELKEGQYASCSGMLIFKDKNCEVQFKAEKVRQIGIGPTLKKRRELLEKLELSGYFDPDKKKPLPQLPQYIILVTSKSSEAVSDIFKVIGNKPGLDIQVIDVNLSSPESIAEGITKADELSPDIIILTRGGGEGLEPFDSEIVAHSIFSADTPIISAVGHERDNPISDYVADDRSATPTEAAKRIFDLYQQYESQSQIDTLKDGQLKAENKARNLQIALVIGGILFIIILIALFSNSGK